MHNKRNVDESYPHFHMYQPFYSWSYSTDTGRSSDLDIITLFRLLKAGGSLPFFNDITAAFVVSLSWHIHGRLRIVREIRLLPYSDEFVQDLHLLPFSPSQNFINLLRNASAFLVDL